MTAVREQLSHAKKISFPLFTTRTSSLAAVTPQFFVLIFFFSAEISISVKKKVLFLIDYARLSFYLFFFCTLWLFATSLNPLLTDYLLRAIILFSQVFITKMTVVAS